MIFRVFHYNGRALLQPLMPNPQKRSAALNASLNEPSSGLVHSAQGTSLLSSSEEKKRRVQSASLQAGFALLNTEFIQK